MMNAGNASTTTQAPSVNFVARNTTVATAVTAAPRPLRLARYRQRGGRVRRQCTTSPPCDKVKPAAASLDPQPRAEVMWTAMVTALDVGDDAAALAARRRLGPLLEGIEDPFLHALC